MKGPLQGFDYIIVGAGSAGCVLANRLSADPEATVLLIEAGGKDRSPTLHIPKALAFAMKNPKLAWQYETRPFGPTNVVETWTRGKTLGGSSSINGMVYNRGQTPDYDAVEALGNPGWGWDSILPIYKKIEDHQLGASEVRGAGGPLHVSVIEDTDEMCETTIDSAVEFGLQRAADVNDGDAERIGYTPGNIKKGRRFSAARAFLHPVTDRPNLTLALHTRAVELLFEGDVAVGVRTRRDGNVVDYRASEEVILSLGSLASPQLLELSGIGAAPVLEAAGVTPRLDSPTVGEHMLEHRALMLQFRLKDDVGYNRMLSTPLRQARTGARYLLTRRGPLALPAYDLTAFCKSRPDIDRPDTQLLIAPFSFGPSAAHDVDLLTDPHPVVGGNPERLPGITCVGYALRPQSEGSVHITSSDPFAPLDLTTGYLTAEHDKQVTVDLFRTMRRMMTTGPLSEQIETEISPGPSVQSDEEIVKEGLTAGICGYHATGTIAMGPRDDAALDPQLRVRGVERLRVIDSSAWPTMVAGNLNAPVMAMAWRAADMILGVDEADSKGAPDAAGMA